MQMIKVMLPREPMSKDEKTQRNHEYPGKPREPGIHRCSKDRGGGGDTGELGSEAWTLSSRL